MTLVAATAMPHATALPPGQSERQDFPRFGLSWFAFRFPVENQEISVRIAGDVRNIVTISEHWRTLPRCDQITDFHCVTSWSRRSLRWSGVRFSDFFHRFVVPNACPADDATFVVIRGEDGYRNSLPLEDLLADDVMLADSLDGQALSMEHGLPLRLVAPAHYGYKSVKHVTQIEFCRNGDNYRFPGPGLMEHHRARVALQERGKYLPGWIYRLFYRPIIGFNVWLFRKGAARYNKRTTRSRT